MKKLTRRGVISIFLALMLLGSVTAQVIQYFARDEITVVCGKIFKWDGELVSSVKTSTLIYIEPGEWLWTAHNHTIEYVGSQCSFPVELSLDNAYAGLNATIYINWVNQTYPFNMEKGVEYDVVLALVAANNLQNGSYYYNLTVAPWVWT